MGHFGHALLGVRVQKVQKVQRVQRVVVGGSAANIIKPLQLGLARGKRGKPYNLATLMENAPLLPTAPPHGKSCHWIFGSFHAPTNPVPLPPRRSAQRT